jgi:site-specific DNA-cytosine methylase
MKALVGCAGFGLVDWVLREFGFDVVGVEIDDAIAEVNRRNGGHCLTADLLDMDPAEFIGWLLYHFSPPCPSFSLANHNSSESDLDIALARKICEFIRVGRPKFFTLENVWLYRKSLSWLLIWYTLLEEGYGVDAWNLNAADYGVPQSRRRMIVIGRRDGRRPAKPWPTHSKEGDMFAEPWQGWYKAIEDLLPDLPETQFAPWQMDRLPGELKTCLMMTGNTNRNGSLPRAYLAPVNGENSNAIDFELPAPTITSSHVSEKYRAFIIGQEERSSLKAADEPADTITANSNQTGIKVFIVGGQYQTPKNGSPRTVQNRGADSPNWTICANDHLDTRICLNDGKVVSLTPRCLARFQGFPDCFVLPVDEIFGDWLEWAITRRRLSCLGIGNALPSGLYRAVLRSLGLSAADGPKTAVFANLAK